jgi:enoyl-[acyl-carrier protein] reductase/trans-2-enoyl-CoA reductase (NAD+)
VNEDNVLDLIDFNAYNQDFLKLFGFGIEGVDYDADISPLVATVL